MSTPQSDNQQAPEGQAPQQLPRHFVLLGIIGIVVVILLVAVLAITVMFEQRQRTEEQKISLVSPVPLPQNFPSPTPFYRYRPQVPDLSKQQIVEAFLDVTGLVDQSNEGRLHRWQHEKVDIVFQGQFQSSDLMCLQNIIAELNPIMGDSHLALSRQTQAPLKIYVVPKTQFASIDINAPPNRDALILYQVGSQGEFQQIKMLINADLSLAHRCWQMHFKALSALGFLSPVAADIPPSYLGKQSLPLGSPFSVYDLEMVRILYSPLLTSGLTRNEVGRRLLPD